MASLDEPIDDLRATYFVAAVTPWRVKIGDNKNLQRTAKVGDLNNIGSCESVLSD